MLKKIKIVILGSLVLLLSCKKNNPPSNPNQVNTNVNITIYRNTPEFQSLLVAGGWIYKAGGVSGIIVYRVAQNETNGDFVAFERNCPYEGGTNTNAIVKVQSDNASVKDTICGSKFYLFSGAIINGPSAYPLKQYSTTYDGNALHIYN